MVSPTSGAFCATVSRTELRALLAIAAAAFALRAGAAVVTEHKPFFPAYYYTDAVFVDKAARDTTEAWSRGERLNRSYSPPQRVHILLTALLYRAVGPHPLSAKLFNALAAACGVAALGLMAGRVFEPTAGLASAAMVALWPSHVFYTSQNFKEGLVCGALLSAFALLTERDAPSRRRAAIGGLAMLVLLGFFRSYVMLIEAAALAAGAAAAILRGGRRTATLITLSACLAAPVVHHLAFRAFFEGPLKASIPGATSENVLIPRIVNVNSGETYRPLSPRGITEYRYWRQYYDRTNAHDWTGREIGSQLFPDEKMSSWVDVLLFIPKVSFYAMFMPLPGLYPLDGKAGRILASAENTVLLLICMLALAAITRDGLDPRRLALLLFFAAMAAVSSMLEFDLGSAGRHKLMYLPMLFPFAAEEALRWTRRWRNA